MDNSNQRSTRVTIGIQACKQLRGPQGDAQAGGCMELRRRAVAWGWGDGGTGAFAFGFGARC